METTTIRWTDEETGRDYDVTATADTIIVAKLAQATRCTDDAKRACVLGIIRDDEDKFWALVDTALSHKAAA